MVARVLRPGSLLVPRVPRPPSGYATSGTGAARRQARAELAQLEPPWLATSAAASAAVSNSAGDAALAAYHRLHDAHTRQHEYFLARSQFRASSMFTRIRRSISVPMRLPVAIPQDASLSPRVAHQAQQMPVHDAIQRVLHPGLIARMRQSLSARKARRLSMGPILFRWRRILTHLLSLGGASTGNTVTVFADGTAAWTSMWHAIEGAQSSIRFESYILEPDAHGRRTMQLLADAARRGVDVSVCYDSWGSSNLLHTRADLDALEAAGAKCVLFNPIWHLFTRAPWRGSLWFRNHRKLMIVDEKIGYCGGMNAACDYLGVDAKEFEGTGKFRDTHLRIEGPGVQDLLDVSRDTFDEAEHALSAEAVEQRKLEKQERQRQARESTGAASAGGKAWGKKLSGWYPKRKAGWYPKRSAELLAVSATAPPAPVSSEAVCLLHPPTPTAESSAAPVEVCPLPASNPSARDLFVQVLPSNVWRNKRLIQKAMLLTVKEAKSHILITNPYFFPPPRLFRALQHASEKRGVKVAVIMAGDGKTDVPITRWASQHIYHGLLRRGVEIFELESATLHAKTVTIDGLYSSIGSFNWDRLSARRNLEVNLTILDPEIAHTMEAQFAVDRTQCRQVTVESLKERNILQRLIHRVAYLVMRWL